MNFTFIELGSKGWENIESFSIHHPRTGTKAIFLLDNRLSEYGNETFYVFEMLTLAQPTRLQYFDNNIPLLQYVYNIMKIIKNTNAIYRYLDNSKVEYL